ncbi:MAG: hypothetical protein ACLQDY_07535 [Streptosporangiaceae bacterium]
MIRELPRDRCPESKVTPELAADRKLRLHPVVLAIDEVQEGFDSPDRDELEKYLRAIIKRGPALGIMLILATQRPDARSLPTSISAQERPRPGRLRPQGLRPGRGRDRPGRPRCVAAPGKT